MNDHLKRTHINMVIVGAFIFALILSLVATFKTTIIDERYVILTNDDGLPSLEE